MVELHEDVKGWLHKQPDWLQQAAELILSKGNLEDVDINSLTDRLKTDEGNQQTANREFAGLYSTASEVSETRLKSIGEIAGIENLEPRDPLDFGTGNLCVIYGNNGSGKSGYTRLLKKAAGKPLAKELKRNVFRPEPAQRKATISYAIDGVNHSPEWIANSPALPALQAVDIFDTDVANNYLSKDSEATYTPPLVSLFDKLVGITRQIRLRLQSQQAELQKALPVLPQQFASTKSGVQFNGLKANSNPAEIQRLKTWDKSDEQELVQLTERLSASDPAATARQKRANKNQIEQIVDQIKKACLAYSDEKLDAIKVKKQDAQAKRKIAQESAQVQSSILQGVGTETWIALWDAARTYSQTAYPQRIFPVVDDARCVLCHQELAEAAKQRLLDFEKFVQGSIEQTAVASESAYIIALEQLPLALPVQTIVQNCQAAGLDDELLVDSIKTFWLTISQVHAAVQIDSSSKEAISVVVPQNAVSTLEMRISGLEEQAVQFDLDAAGFNRADETKKKIEADARKWISQQAEAIDSEILRLRQRSIFDEWIKLTNTTQITQKGGQVAEAAITEAYVARFNKELAVLKADRIRVKLVKTKAEKGRVYHGLQLEGVVDVGAKLEQVLSEGERRVICLAAFLADVVEKPNASTFIFDDPISSLDQDFETAVASRLIQLARNRQVLVFTHRLSLYGALEDSAKKMGSDWQDHHLEQRCIETFSNVSGRPVSQPIWASNTKAANNDLLSRLAKAKKAGEESGGDAYRALAQGICGDFRKLIERTIETDLLGGVVIRHRRSVQTDGRLAKLSVIKPDDLLYLDELMTKYSVFEHSQSDETPASVPDADELENDLASLGSWRDGHKKRPVSGVANV